MNDASVNLHIQVFAQVLVLILLKEPLRLMLNNLPEIP